MSVLLSQICSFNAIPESQISLQMLSAACCVRQIIGAAKAVPLYMSFSSVSFYGSSYGGIDESMDDPEPLGAGLFDEPRLHRGEEGSEFCTGNHVRSSAMRGMSPRVRVLLCCSTVRVQMSTSTRVLVHYST
jgi:hypothetical protein